MKVYQVFNNSGSSYEPLQLTKALANKMRHDVCMPDPKTTYVRTLVVQENSKAKKLIQSVLDKMK